MNTSRRGLFVDRYAKKREPWPGCGYIRHELDGRRTWVIERQVGGRRYHVSTRAHSERAAYEHLRRFESDPDGYMRAMEGGRPEPAGLRMTADLITEYREHLLNRDRPTTVKYANEMEHRLEDWLVDLGGRDLRRLDLGHLKEKLRERGGSRQHRIIALKGFMGWLRGEKHLLDRKDDVTLDLPVPQAVPEKHKRRKAVPVESVRAALSHLAPTYRDCLLLLSHVGWHVTELERFARQEESRIAPGRGQTLAVLQVRHKVGHISRTPVMDPDVLAAAQRIRERGQLPRYLNTTLKAACRAAGVPEFTFGVMRHSVATWAIESGTPADVVAEFLGHADRKTTLAFYADVAVPTPPIVLPKLT